MRSWVVRSTFCTASLMAAATRSSSISLSSLLTMEGSSDTRFTSCLPVITTLAMPPPASPVTSSWAISACARCMLACSCCACFMMLPMLPFIKTPSIVVRPDRIGRHGGAENLSHGAHVRIGLDGGAGVLNAILRRLFHLFRRCIDRGGAAHGEIHTHGLTVISGERLHQFIFHHRRPVMLAFRIERELHHIALAALERAMRRQVANDAGEVHLRDH